MTTFTDRSGPEAAAGPTLAAVRDPEPDPPHRYGRPRAHVSCLERAAPELLNQGWTLERPAKEHFPPTN